MVRWSAKCKVNIRWVSGEVQGNFGWSLKYPNQGWVRVWQRSEECQMMVRWSSEHQVNPNLSLTFLDVKLVNGCFHLLLIFHTWLKIFSFWNKFMCRRVKKLIHSLVQIGSRILLLPAPSPAHSQCCPFKTNNSCPNTHTPNKWIVIKVLYCQARGQGQRQRQN